MVKIRPIGETFCVYVRTRCCNMELITVCEFHQNHVQQSRVGLCVCICPDGFNITSINPKWPYTEAYKPNLVTTYPPNPIVQEVF